MANPNFDAQSFLHNTIDAPLADEPVLIPQGEYEATIDKIGVKPAKDNDSGVNLNIQWEINDPELKAQLDRVKIIVPQFMFVVLDENGRLDVSGDKNWRLGQVKTAVGQENAKPWHVAMLEGAGPARVRVNHNTFNGNTNAQVDRVVKL